MDYAPSDLVLDSRIQVEFSNGFTYRFTTQSKVSSTRYVRRRPRKDTWQVVKTLGRGSYGTVTLHKCLTSDGQAELQAVKRIDKLIVSDGIDYYKELEAIAKFSQKKYEGLFVDFLGWYENDDSVFIVMEYMEHGDLDSNLRKPLPENEAREITSQIAEGLKLLHENGFAHRDLKPANIFVFRTSPSWWVKIGDFGFSKRIHENGGLQTWVGTPVFLAPELQMFYSSDMSEMSDEKTAFRYTEKVDMWALGVIAFYMVYHTYPFPPNKPTSLPRYMQGADLLFPKTPLVSQDCKNFIKATLSRDALQRLSAQEATEGGWLMCGDDPIPELAVLEIEETKTASRESSQKITDLMKKTIFNHGNERLILEMYPQPNSSESTIGKDSIAAHNDSSSTSATQYDSAPLEDLVPALLGKWQALHTFGVNLYHEKDFEKAEHMLRQAAKGRNRVLGQKHKDTRNSYHCLGVLYYHMSRYSEAKRLFQVVLKAQGEMYGPNNVSTLKSRYWIGLLTCREGNSREGLAILERVVERQKNALGPEHPDTLLSLSAIEQEKPPQIVIPPQMEDDTESMQQSIWEIAPLLRQNPSRPQETPTRPKKFRWVIRGVEKALIVFIPRNSPQLPPNPKLDGSDLSKIKAHYQTMAELGQRLHGQGEYDAAQSRLETATRGLKYILGPTHADFLDTLYWLGRNEYELNQFETAEKLFREVADGLTETLGKSDRQTLNCLHALGLALSNQEKHRQAESVFRSVFEGLEPISDAYDQDLVHALFRIGYSLYKQGRSEEAEPILEDALEKRDCLLGPAAEDTIECVFWLGRALFDLRRYHESEEAFRWTFVRRQDNTDISTSFWLGLAMYHRRKYEQAIPFLRQAFSLRNTRLGEHDLDTLCSAYWLGLAYYHRAKYAEAEPLFLQAMTGSKKRFGTSDQDTLDCLHWYGEVLSLQQKSEMAHCVWKSLIQGYKTFFGLAQPQIRTTITLWVRSLAPQERFIGANLFFREEELGLKSQGSES